MYVSSHTSAPLFVVNLGFVFPPYFRLVVALVPLMCSQYFPHTLEFVTNTWFIAPIRGDTSMNDACTCIPSRRGRGRDIRRHVRSREPPRPPRRNYAKGGERGEGRDESKRHRAESQRIVAAWPLCRLQYPVAYLSRLQRIQPAARQELNFKASDTACLPRGMRLRHVPLGTRGPLLRVGKRAAGACVAASPDSDLEAFSHNPAHGGFAPLAFQPSAMTNCANQRFLSY